MPRHEPYGDIPSYGNVVNGDGRVVLKWVLGLFGALIVVALTAGITWAVGISGRIAAVEAGQAVTNERLQSIIELVRHRRGP